MDRFRSVTGGAIGTPPTRRFRCPRFQKVVSDMTKIKPRQSDFWLAISAPKTIHLRA
jgi:hypothetical protein